MFVKEKEVNPERERKLTRITFFLLTKDLGKFSKARTYEFPEIITDK